MGPTTVFIIDPEHLKDEVTGPAFSGLIDKGWRPISTHLIEEDGKQTKIAYVMAKEKEENFWLSLAMQAVIITVGVAAGTFIGLTLHGALITPL